MLLCGPGPPSQARDLVFERDRAGRWPSGGAGAALSRAGAAPPRAATRSCCRASSPAKLKSSRCGVQLAPMGSSWRCSSPHLMRMLVMATTPPRPARPCSPPAPSPTTTGPRQRPGCRRPQLLGKYLDQDDLLTCREVCRLWNQHVANGASLNAPWQHDQPRKPRPTCGVSRGPATAGNSAAVASRSIPLPHPPPAGVDTAEALLSRNQALELTPLHIKRALPHLQCLKLRMTARAQGDDFQLFCQAAAGMKQLNELQLLLTTPEAPSINLAFDMNLAGGCCSWQLVACAALQRTAQVAGRSRGASAGGVRAETAPSPRPRPPPPHPQASGCSSSCRASSSWGAGCPPRPTCSGSRSCRS
jgi:hypothetical protein